MIIPLAGIILQTFACVGSGAIILHLLGLWHGRDVLERCAMAFGLGFGFLGWLLFFLGVSPAFGVPAIWTLLVVLSAGNILHWTQPGHVGRLEFSGLPARALLAIGGFILAVDVLEALSPPVEADTLAYHFMIARFFLESGGIVFQPVAFSGAIPLLVHMTYTSAAAVGGQSGMTLWALVSGWATPILFFVVVRRWMPDGWALALAVLFQALPAVVYGGGSGQVEVRLAIFVLIAVIGCVDLPAVGWKKATVLTGLGAGFLAGAKLTGVFFATAIAAVLLIWPGPRLKRVIVFGLVTALAGFQWYLWNFIHTGDPLFPMLFDLTDRLGLATGGHWNAEHERIFREYLATRGSVVAESHWRFSYPIMATFAPLPQFGSGRIGLGPFVALAAPMTIVALWHLRSRILLSRLLPLGAVLIGFYFLWIELGGIPKIRHILPVVPLLFLCLTVPIFMSGLAWLKRPLALAIALSLMIGTGTQALYAFPLAALQFGSLDQDSFLRQNVMSYSAAEVINDLEGVKKVFLWDRQLKFYINAPTFFASPYGQTKIRIAEGYVVPMAFYEDLKKEGVSHVLSRRPKVETPAKTPQAAIIKLAGKGCLKKAAETPYYHFNSRTLKSIWNSAGYLDVWRVETTCDGTPG